MGDYVAFPTLAYFCGVKYVLYILVAILLLPALLLHLGQLAFIDDEGIRSLVAQEMIWSGNYWVPTLHGDPYLNKPPLWNWLLTLSFRFFGEASEWTARFPTVLSLLAFGCTTYGFSRFYFGKQLAFVHAFTVITCGRMLFWDSMLALIDVCFSWVVYSFMLSLFHYGQQGRWRRAFGLFYTGVALAFMLKGLPAFTFGAFTLLAYVWWAKAWPQLLKPAHLLSGLWALAILGAYYWQYSQYIDLRVVAERLLEESSKRTAVHHGWQATIKQLVSFPFEMFYHFLPWTLLLVFFFAKGAWQQLKAQPAASFMLLAFVVNIPLYWTSPNVYPRYLLMLFPLLFGAGLYLYDWQRQQNTRLVFYFHRLLLGLMLLASLLFFFIPLVPETEIIPQRWAWAGLMGLAGAGISYLYWQSIAVARPHQFGGFLQQLQKHLPRQAPLLSFVAFMLVFRLVFNIFVLPPRVANNTKGNTLKATALSLGQRYAKEADSLAIFGFSLMEPASSFYLSQGYEKIVPRRFDAIYKGEVYVLCPWQYPEVLPLGLVVDSLFMRHQSTAPYFPALLLRTRQLKEKTQDTDQSSEPPAAIPFSTDYDGPIGDGMGTGLWRKQ